MHNEQPLTAIMDDEAASIGPLGVNNNVIGRWKKPLFHSSCAKK